MNVNPSSIARGRTASRLEFPLSLFCDARKTQRFCTVYVGPPPPVQNYLHPKTFRANNFKRHPPSAHRKVWCKTRKIASATHFRSNTAKTNAQKHRPNAARSQTQSSHLAPRDESPLAER